MKCEYEGEGDVESCSGEIVNRHAMTDYHFEGITNSPEDPNKDFLACDGHYEGYEQFWQEQWDEYHGVIYEGISGALARQENSYLEDESPSVQDLFEDFVSKVSVK